MRLRHDWKHILWRAWSVRFAFLSAFCTLISTSVLWVFADDLGDELYTGLVVGFFVLGQVFLYLIPAARVVKQKGVSGDL